MTEIVALVVRWAHAGASVTLLGTLGFVLLVPDPSVSPLVRWRQQWHGFALLLAISILLLSLAALAVQATVLAHSQSVSATAITLVRESRFGHVLALRLIAIVVLIVALAYAWRRTMSTRTYGLALAGGASVILAASAWSGHSAAEEPAGPALATHVIHLVCLSLWLGALPALYSLVNTTSASKGEHEIASRTFHRFSRLATWLIPLIIASGIGLAIVHVRLWTALLGTTYGALILLKLVLLVGALLIAAKIRWRYLPMLATSDAVPGELKRWLRVEVALGFAILVTAATLAQTIPARHDDIEWILPFRLSLDALAETPDMRAFAWASISVFLAAIVIASLLWILRRRVFAGIAAFVALAAFGTTLWALSFEAYPETYRKSSVPYQAVSVARGAELFAKHCVSCHGENARGDGPLAKGMLPRPANLTEPHTALHTAGDIFRWLSIGRPPSAMPGFSAQLSEDDRWDVINYLRTLSVGYQARIISDRVVALKPWLGAVDFNYLDQRDVNGTLKDHRERDVVLLVVHTGGDESTRRLELLSTALAQQQLHSLSIIATSNVAIRSIENAPPAFTVVTESGAQVISAYALLRRTLQNADAENRTPIPSHQEFLIDRYGYIRARWNPRESSLWNDLTALQTQVTQLAREQKVREPPEDHVH